MPQFRDPNEKRDFMLNTPIPRLVPKMALPSIAGMLVTSAYNLADTLFVSQLGTDATGAVGVNGSIDLIIMMAGSLLAVGAASLTSRLLGAKQDERAREVLSTCFFLALALGTLVLILGFTYQNKILLLLGANEEILPYSEQYCRYILLAAPFMATSFVLNQCLRAEGSAVFSMIGMVAGAAVAAAGAGAAGYLLLPDTASYGPALGRVGHRVGAGRGGHARDAACRADRRARLARHPAAGGRAGGRNIPGVSFFARMDVYS